MPTQTFASFFDKLKLDAKQDTVDFRDKMYEPTLVEVPTHIEIDEYKQYNVPILNQGQEGACTGFGLAAVAHYLLRRRKVIPDTIQVSPRMFYEMAKRYDEIPGEGYSGSSARGAMKGWHKHGVCSLDAWPYVAGKEDRTLSNERAADAVKRPLGAYFRVNHIDLVAMHSAISEVGILYATGKVHEGWGKMSPDGVIPYEPGFKIRGGHAFALVGYNEKGYWMQNSWGEWWGKGGFALITYDDWLANGMDVWVARLGVPIQLRTTEATITTQAPGARASQSYAYSDIRPHIISIGKNGHLNPGGTYGTAQSDVEEIFANDIPRLTQDWKKKRLLLYAPGGLTSESVLVKRIAEYRSELFKQMIYPLAFIWYSDFMKVVSSILQEALKQRKPDGVSESSMDFMRDRLDDTLEPLVYGSFGKTQWQQLKENARLATTHRLGGARIALDHLVKLISKDPSYEVHLVGHGAGGIFLASLVQLLTSPSKVPSGRPAQATGHGIQAASCTLWAPSLTATEFNRTFLPAVQAGQIKRFALYTLTDEAERDDQCAGIYNKSLLYLISNALEDQPTRASKGERQGVPLIGMAKYVEADKKLSALLRTPAFSWIQSPNDAPEDTPWAAHARSHGAFEDDRTTLRSTLTRILAP